MKTLRLLLTPALVLLSACGSGSRGAVGEVTTIIVAAPQALWDAIGDSVMSALEPELFTVRDERAFEVSHVTPDDPNWNELQVFRQVVTFGAASDPWVQPVLDVAGGTQGVVVANRAWARDQLAIAAVLPSSTDTEAALALVPRVAAVVDSAFRAHVLSRMYTSGADTLLRDTLRAAERISIVLPNVYNRVASEPGTHLFQNNTNVGGALARSVLITSRPGVTQPTVEEAVSWRQAIAQAYSPPQETLLDRIESEDVDGGGVQIQGAWSGTDPTWPAGGVFISRMIPCPALERTFFLDTWLYAPSGRRSKYEYMIQLETILDTFECGS